MNMENTDAANDRIAPQVTHSSIIQLMGKAISIGIGIAVTMVLTRRMPVADYGKYALIFAFISFFSVLMDFGTMMIATRETSRNPSRAGSILGNLIIVKFIWALFLMLLAYLTAQILRYPADLKFLIFIASFTLFFSSLGILEIVFRIYFKMEYAVIAGAIGSLISGAAVTAYLFAPYFTLSGVVAINTITSVFSGIFLFMFSKKFVKLDFRIDMGQMKMIFTESLPQGIAAFLSAMYFNIDTVLISKLANETSVAYYSTAYKILQIMILMPSIIMISVFPLLSKYSADRNALKLIYQKTFYYLLLTGASFAVLLNVFSREIILVLYSEKYLISSPALSILGWAGAVIFCSNLLGNMIVAINRQKIGVIIAFLALILNIGLNFYFIPIYGFLGAAIVTVITEVFVMILILIAVNFYEKILPFSFRLIKAFIFVFLLYIAVSTLKKFNLIISIVSVIPIYLLLLFILKCYQEDFSLTDILRRIFNFSHYCKTNNNL